MSITQERRTNGVDTTTLFATIYTVIHADHPAVLVGDDHGPTPAELVSRSRARSAVFDVLTHGTAVTVDVVGAGIGAAHQDGGAR